MGKAEAFQAGIGEVTVQLCLEIALVQDVYKRQAISYTTGVPAMCGALMLLTGKWTQKGVHTVEEFDPDPFLDALDKYGLPRSKDHDPVLVEDVYKRQTRS